MEQHFLKLKEQAEHVNAALGLNIYNVVSDTGVPNRIHCHWHEEIEILLVTEGRASLYLNNECTTIAQGSVVLISSNQLHLATCPVGESFSFMSIIFHPGLLGGSVNNAIQRQYIDPLLHPDNIFPVLSDGESDWQEQVRQLLCEIQDIFFHKDFEYELLIKTRLYEIWHLYSMHFTPPKKVFDAHLDYRIRLTKDIIEYIQEHYDGALSLKDIAQQFRLSREYLCRFFKSMAQVSLMEYLNFYRISIGRELLRHTDAEISTIARKTGFNNVSYFGLTFNKYTHMTPSQYREDHAASDISTGF